MANGDFKIVLPLLVIGLTGCLLCNSFHLETRSRNDRRRWKRQTADETTDDNQSLETFLDEMFDEFPEEEAEAQPTSATDFWNDVSEEETEPSPGPILTTQSPVTSTTPAMATTQAENVCYMEPYVNGSCYPVPKELSGVSFWNIYDMIFVDSVLEELQLFCVRGSWCGSVDSNMVYDKANFFLSSDLVTLICQPEMLECMLGISESYGNCSVYSRMAVTSEAFQLLCEIRNNNNTEQNETMCIEKTLEALHITMADVLSGPEIEDVYDGFFDDTCNITETRMLQTHICLSPVCPHNTDALESFSCWQWFLNDTEALLWDCSGEIGPQNCPHTASPPSNELGVPVTESFLPTPEETTVTVVITTTQKITDENTTQKIADEFTTQNIAEGSTNQKTSNITVEANTDDDKDGINFDGIIDDDDVPDLDMTGENDSMTSSNEQQESDIVWIYPADMQTLIGVSVASLVALVGLTFLVCACWKKRKNVKVNTEGYTQLLSDEP